jgi:hypothetical protein
MSGSDPIGADKRRARARRRIPPGVGCAVCGITDPRILHGDHTGAHANDDVTVVLCLNHHHLDTLGQLALGVQFTADPARTDVQRLSSALRGQAAYYSQLAPALMEFADMLDAHVRDT